MVTVNEHNDVHAFKITVGAEPLFSTVKADKRSRIQDTAISAEAMLPGGPYDLWRSDEPSRRVKDLVSAFAENPKLPKMLRQKEIIDTVDQGVRDGLFVAALTRPDKSIKTWWRTPIDEVARKEPALEVFLPEKATLSELHPGVLSPGVLPSLWNGDEIVVSDLVSYFSGGHTVMVPKEGYEEPVVIPACPAAAVEAAISDAVREGGLWLLNGPASFQGEPLPSGVLTGKALLRGPMGSLSVDRLMQDALPDAWKDGRTTALALSVGLSAQIGSPIPWTVLRRTIDDAIKSRWLELAPDSGTWPCEMSGATTISLKQPDQSGGMDEPPKPYGQKGVYASKAELEASELQDLVDALPEIIKAAAGVPLRFEISVTLGDGKDLSPETIEALNGLLEEVSSNLRLKA